MPIYEYHCKKCDGIFEELQGFNDKPLKKCRDCGGSLERLISLSAFHLKGSGWYETDYGKKKTLKSVDSNNGNKNTGEQQSDTKADSTTPESTHESIKKDTEKAKQKTKDT